MIHSICVIDDGIPTEQEKSVEIDVAKQLDANTLRFLLREEIVWSTEEDHLKSLVSELIDAKEYWNVSAFKHPNFLMHSIENELCRPEIVIYDWEFHTKPGEQIEALFRILNECFTVVFIYSGADKEDEIREVMASDRFKPFVNRMEFIDKGSYISGTPSETILIEKVCELRDSNFSFKFGTKIRQKSLEAVDRILVELGKATLNDVSAYFNLTHDTKRDLVDFIGERFRNRLNGIDMGELPDESEVPVGTYDEALAKELWAYRLYFHPGESDNIVRRGDVVYKVEDGTDRLYLVISADCDLDRFWHKNFGSINLIPLIKIDKSQIGLIEKLTATVDPHKIRSELTQPSLTSRISCLAEGPFVLPLIKIGNDFANYMGYPKEIFSVSISKPDGLSRDQLKNERLKYSHWVEYKRIVTVAEPFLSPLIEHVIKSLSGYGVPDYPATIKETIENISKEALG